MKPFRDWARPARYFTLTIVFLLLTFGLCSAGPAFDTPGTAVQNAAAWLGILTFLCFLGSLIATAGSTITALVDRWKR